MSHLASANEIAAPAPPSFGRFMDLPAELRIQIISGLDLKTFISYILADPREMDHYLQPRLTITPSIYHRILQGRSRPLEVNNSGYILDRQSSGTTGLPTELLLMILERLDTRKDRIVFVFAHSALHRKYLPSYIDRMSRHVLLSRCVDPQQQDEDTHSTGEADQEHEMDEVDEALLNREIQEYIAADPLRNLPSLSIDDSVEHRNRPQEDVDYAEAYEMEEELDGDSDDETEED